MIQKQRDLLSNVHGFAVLHQTKKQIRDKSNSFVHYLNSSGNKNDVTKNSYKLFKKQIDT